MALPPNWRQLVQRYYFGRPQAAAASQAPPFQLGRLAFMQPGYWTSRPGMFGTPAARPNQPPAQPSPPGIMAPPGQPTATPLPSPPPPSPPPASPPGPPGNPPNDVLVNPTENPPPILPSMPGLYAALSGMATSPVSAQNFNQGVAGLRGGTMSVPNIGNQLGTLGVTPTQAAPLIASGVLPNIPLPQIQTVANNLRSGSMNGQAAANWLMANTPLSGFGAENLIAMNTGKY